MFEPKCYPILIGSLPLENHDDAVGLILKYSQKIPVWPQLPGNPKEGMTRQFIDGMPCLSEQHNNTCINQSADNFTDEVTSFYQDFLETSSADEIDENSRFALTRETAEGFFAFTRKLLTAGYHPITVKGQVTGPVTAGIALKDQDSRPVFYDDTLRDIMVKLLAMKARWQVENLRPFTSDIPPIIFIDEPGIVSFGSTALAGVSQELAVNSVLDIINVIKQSGGLAGVHICANGDWGPVLNSAADIISFDAYSFFNNFILYRNQLSTFINRGGVLAWGIVPTGDPAAIEAASTESLFNTWKKQLDQLASLGHSPDTLARQTLIAPSCGTGSLSPRLATKVLEITHDLSFMTRREFSFAR